MIALYLLILLAWTFVCVQAGRLFEAYREEREDSRQRDVWANRDEKGTR